MSQGALSTANGPGGTVRAGINAAIARLATRASGTGRPADIATGENWIETDNPGGGVWSEWKFDGSNDILLRLINATGHTITPASVTTTKGDLIKRGTSSDARFGVGSAHQLIGVNSAGDDLEFKNAGWVRLAADSVPVSVANISWTSIPSYVKHLRIVGKLLPATNTVNLGMQWSQGGVFDTGASAYNYAILYGDSGGGAPVATGNNGNVIPFSNANQLNASTNGGIDFDCLIVDVQATFNTVRSHIRGQCFTSTPNSSITLVSGRGPSVAGAIDGVRLLFNSGNIASGRVSIMGLMA